MISCNKPDFNRPVLQLAEQNKTDNFQQDCGVFSCIQRVMAIKMKSVSFDIISKIFNLYLNQRVDTIKRDR